MRTSARRVGRIERQTVSDQWGVVPIIDPNRWPDDVRAAYEAADQARDWNTVAAIVEAQTGTRPCPERTDGVPWLIEIGHAPPRTD